MKIYTRYNSSVQNRYTHIFIPKYNHNQLCFRSRDFLELSKKDIFEKVKASMQPESFIGQGTEAEVYRIKDTDYCVRIPHEMIDISDFKYCREITPVDNVNHVVLNLGYGTSVRRYFEGVTPKAYINDFSGRLNLQEKISEMPIKSYTDLLHQIANAADNEMLFDCSPGNLVVDIDKQHLTAIDFFPMSENPRAVRPLTEMYSVLTYYGSSEKIGKKIFDKIVDAALEEFKPEIIPCMDLALFDFANLCIRRKRDCYLPDAEAIINQIMHNVDLLKKIKKAEIMDKTLLESLNQKICEVRNVIKKIR